MSTEPAGTGRPTGKLDAALRAFEEFSSRRRRLFWTLHSMWALATGLVVVVLAHERYSFVPWVFAMLALTWISTLFVSRPRGGASSLRRMGHGFISYLTRVMYQETLFFLLPFYVSSTPLLPLPAASAAFLLILVVLAVLSCLDLPFDWLLQRSPLFALLFFSTVAFAALNLLLPVVLRVPLAKATAVAAWCAVASGLPLSLRGQRGQRGLGLRALLGSVVAASVAAGLIATSTLLIPPVPLRLKKVVFAQDVDRVSLRVRDELHGPIAAAELGDGRLAAMVTVFAPTRSVAEVRLEWERNGDQLRESRAVEIVGQEGGFRVWDALVFPDGKVQAGRYRLSVYADGRLLGRGEIVVS